MDILNGVIKRINYYNDANGYAVVIMELDYKNKKASIHQNKIIGNTIAAVGCFDRRPQENEEYSLEGEFVRDKNYGLQFKFTKFTRTIVKTSEGVISYLSSSMFPGIGPKIAKQLIEKLGPDCLSKIKDDASVLDNLDLTDKQKSTIRLGIISDEVSQENTIFFLDNGLTMDMAHKIIATFGEMAKEIVLENPYIIMEKIERFGFKKNDAFALKIGIAENSVVRLKALLSYVLQEALYNIGNSYITKADLFDYTIKYLGKDIDSDTFEEVLHILVDTKKIFIDENKHIFDYKMYIQEIDLAKEIVSILKGTRDFDKKPLVYNDEEINKYYLKVKNNANITFNHEQEQAILSAFSEPLIIITGGPGTGKTTIIKAIIEMYLKLNKENSALNDYIALLAPTGKAAKRLKEATNMQAMTIHKFLGYMGSNIFTYSKYNKTQAKLIIVDEASMMDLPIASRLITSMQPDARMIIVGDVDQLPSVGPGQVLKDLIDSREIKTIRLNKIHRQSENSSIIKLAHNVNEGILPENMLDKLNDRVFIQTDNFHLADLLVDIANKYILNGYDIKKDIQILIPMYKGDCGINEINARIQDIVNPYIDDDHQIKHYGQIFRENDKVIQLVNRAEKGIMNGDVGYIDGLIYNNLKVVGLRVAFDSVMVEYNLEELEELSLAYAISVHKAQGGEFDVVIMPITSKHYIMLKRKLIYTAITRAKKILILIGDVKMMQQSIRKIETNRKTILKDKIYEYLNAKENILLTNKQNEDNQLEADDEFGSQFTDLNKDDFMK